jgi:hypothetical protein
MEFTRYQTKSEHTMTNSSESNLLFSDEINTIHGSMTVEGNLDVQRHITTNGLSVVSDGSPVLHANGTGVSFKKTVEFLKGAQFNNGKTIIGMETT